MTLKCKPAPLFPAYHGYRHLFEGKWGKADLYPLESRETDRRIQRLFFPFENGLSWQAPNH